MAQIIIDEGAAPSTPASGKVASYAKADGLLYSKDDAGNEYQLSGAQTTGIATVASATTVDIFGAAGATVGIDNSTPVTTTDFTDCLAAQVGSVKRVIPVQAWTVTASASLTINGITTGTITIPAGTILEILASTTSTFVITSLTPFWISPTFAAGDFTASGSMTWNVDSGDVATYQYTLNGKVMTVSFVINTTSVGGTLSDILLIKVPAGKTIGNTVGAACYAAPTGTAVISICRAISGSNNISIYANVAGANWSASTNTCYVSGEITFGIV